MKKDKMLALLEESRDWGQSLPEHPHEEAILERFQEVLARQNPASIARLLLRAYAEHAPKPKPYPLTPGMVAGYWFRSGETAPGRPPEYAASSALLASGGPGGPDVEPAIVLVERGGDWLPLTDHVASSYEFTRDETAQFVAWGEQGRLVQQSRFVTVHSRLIPQWYGKALASRCLRNSRIIGVVHANATASYGHKGKRFYCGFPPYVPAPRKDKLNREW